ncbi:hypothetical protein Dimus_031864 [Dionaea muscipula]
MPSFLFHAAAPLLHARGFLLLHAEPSLLTLWAPHADSKCITVEEEEETEMKTTAELKDGQLYLSLRISKEDEAESVPLSAGKRGSSGSPHSARKRWSSDLFACEEENELGSPCQRGRE